MFGVNLVGGLWYKWLLGRPIKKCAEYPKTGNKLTSKSIADGEPFFKDFSINHQRPWGETAVATRDRSQRRFGTQTGVAYFITDLVADALDDESAVDYSENSEK